VQRAQTRRSVEHGRRRLASWAGTARGRARRRGGGAGGGRDPRRRGGAARDGRLEAPPQPFDQGGRPRPARRLPPLLVGRRHPHRQRRCGSGSHANLIGIHRVSGERTSTQHRRRWLAWRYAVSTTAGVVSKLTRVTDGPPTCWNVAERASPARTSLVAVEAPVGIRHTAPRRVRWLPQRPPARLHLRHLAVLSSGAVQATLSRNPVHPRFS